MKPKVTLITLFTVCKWASPWYTIDCSADIILSTVTAGRRVSRHSHE